MQKNDKSLQDCSVIILSYNTKELTNKCILSAKKAATYAANKLGNHISIIVLDNASEDGSLEMIVKNHPDVVVIQKKRNVGFAKGNNIAMRKVKSSYIWILNSDAFLQKDAIAKGIVYLQEHKEIDAIVSRLLYPGGEFQPSWGNLPTPLNSILWSMGVEQIPLVKKIIRPIYSINKKLYIKPRVVEWCSSASFLLRKHVFTKTRGYDENIFMYLEDVEWCKRIYDLGMKIAYVPAIKTIHIGSSSSKKESKVKKLDWQIKGMTYFHDKHYPRSAIITKGFLYSGIFLRKIMYLFI